MVETTDWTSSKKLKKQWGSVVRLQETSLVRYWVLLPFDSIQGFPVGVGDEERRVPFWLPTMVGRWTHAQVRAECVKEYSCSLECARKNDADESTTVVL